MPLFDTLTVGVPMVLSALADTLILGVAPVFPLSPLLPLIPLKAKLKFGFSAVPLLDTFTVGVPVV